MSDDRDDGKKFYHTIDNDYRTDDDDDGKDNHDGKPWLKLVE